MPLRKFCHSAAAITGLLLLTAACGPGPVAPELERYAPTAGPSPTAIDPAKVPDCLTPGTRALGLGLTEYKTEAEARAALGNEMLFPDPATLAPDAHFVSGYFNAAMQGAFTQSTMGLIYDFGDQSEGERSLTILYLSQLLPFAEPQEPHGTTTVRGGKEAYTFKPPFRPTLNSIQWKEDCRLVSVIADLPADDVKRIAEGLHFPGGGTSADR